MVKILLGITGGIASYKSCELIRLLRQNKIDCKVCMTKNAREFVTALAAVSYTHLTLPTTMLV